MLNCALGYRLLGLKKVKEAIEIFKLNVEAYPQPYNVYDSLGESYMVNGDIELAIKNYQRLLELKPQNTNAVEMLKELRANRTYCIAQRRTACPVHHLRFVGKPNSQSSLVPQAGGKTVIGATRHQRRS